MDEAILVLDMTRDSVDEKARSVELRRKTLPRVKDFLAWGRKTGRPVIFVCSARRPTDKWFLGLWEKANMIDTPGAEPIAELFVRGDLTVRKRRYDGFYGSDLEVTLREMDVNSLILIGWSTQLAVLTTAVAAWQRAFRTTVVSDLCVAHKVGNHSIEQFQEWSLDYMAAFAQSKIVTSKQLMETA